MFLGIDTSNYTTSVATITEKDYISHKIMLTVKEGERGLRQSEAFYQHSNNLPGLIEKLDLSGLNAVGVSSSPTSAEGSYMPCFNAGVNFAKVISKTLGVSRYSFSHQAGHIAAALLSSAQTKLMDKEFIAFHVSGGTTEAVLVTPDEEKVFKTKLLVSSSDLKAGQAIDRVGVRLGLSFPCGKELEKLALKCEPIKVKVPVKDGCPSLSGIENKTNNLIEQNADKAYVARFTLESIKFAIDKMTEYVTEQNNFPVVYSGGVMSNKIISEYLKSKYNCFFAEPELSRDNAVGTAFLAKYITEK